MNRSKISKTLVCFCTLVCAFVTVRLFTEVIPITNPSNVHHQYKKVSYLIKTKSAETRNNFYMTPPKVNVVDCLALFEANEDEQNKAKRFVQMRPRPIISDGQYADMLYKGGCSSLQWTRYGTEPLSEKEAQFPIVFSILVYRNVQQFERLLQTIYHPQNHYCIHVDRDSSRYLKASVKYLASCFDNVFVASKLESVLYAGFTRLQADINCMNDSLNLNTGWKYYINLSSEMLPLKTNAEMVKILNLYNGSNDIEGITGHRLEQIAWRFRTQWKISVTGKKPVIVRTGIKKMPPPHNITIVRGSAYGIFSRDFVDYVINNKYAHDLLEWSRDTYSPDEHYWATLHHLKENKHLETPGGYNGVPDDKPWLAAYVSWCGRDTCGSGRCVHGVCIFGLQDMPILASRREFFANKFYMDFEYLTVDCLCEWLYNKTVYGIIMPMHDFDFYRHLPFVKE